MNEEDIYAGCTRLRLQLADWLATLRPEELGTRSLCSEWSVRDVAGHLVAGLQLKTSDLVLEILRQRLQVNRANTVIAHRMAVQPLHMMLAQLREHAGRRLKVPLVGVHGPLIDLLVHGGDMRLPLRVPMPSEPDLTIAALNRLIPGFPGLVPRARLRGLSLVATDVTRTWGHGPAVEGEINNLLMAISGRRAALPGLNGPGVNILAQRL